MRDTDRAQTNYIGPHATDCSREFCNYFIAWSPNGTFAIAPTQANCCQLSASAPSRNNRYESRPLSPANCQDALVARFKLGSRYAFTSTMSERSKRTIEAAAIVDPATRHSPSRSTRLSTFAKGTKDTPCGFILFGPTEFASSAITDAPEDGWGAGRAYPATDKRLWAQRWHNIHLEEIIANPAHTNEGIGLYFLSRWATRVVQTAGSRFMTAAGFDRRSVAKELADAQALVPSVVARKAPLFVRRGDRVELRPTVTLAVDAWNVRAMRLYSGIGFVRYHSDGLCPGRLVMIVSIHALVDLANHKLEKKYDKTGGRPPILAKGERKLTMHRWQALLDDMEKTEPDPVRRGLRYFDRSNLARKSLLGHFIEWLYLVYTDDHAWPPGHDLSDDFPDALEGLRTYIQRAVDNDRAALNPMPGSEVTDDHVRSLILDRLLSRPIRVLMTDDEWLAHVGSTARRSAQPWQPDVDSETAALMADKFVYVLTSE